MSIDGFGDFASTAWGYGNNTDIKIDNKIYFPHSLGIFYQALTQFLGFKNYGDEYKIMGLSSYGKPIFESEISEVLFNTNFGYKLNLDYFVHHNQSIIKNDEKGQIVYKDLYSKKMTQLLGPEIEH